MDILILKKAIEVPCSHRGIEPELTSIMIDKISYVQKITTHDDCSIHMSNGDILRCTLPYDQVMKAIEDVQKSL